MKSLFNKSVLLLSVFFLLNTVGAAEVAGVKLDDTIQVANTTLKLNGAGIRKKVFFKVYVAALYQTETKNNAAEILALSGPKKMNLTLLRDIGSDTFAEAFMEGIKKNSDEAEMKKLQDQIKEFRGLFSTVAEFKHTDTVSLEWIPDVGTNVIYNGKKLGKSFPGVAFYNALLRIWLGDNPVDADLKSQLLGGVVSR